MAVESARGDLLRKFTDEGDLMLGHALETTVGRSLYNHLAAEVDIGLTDSLMSVLGDNSWDLVLEFIAHNPDLPVDNRRIILIKMIEKATNNWIREKLR